MGQQGFGLCTCTWLTHFINTACQSTASVLFNTRRCCYHERDASITESPLSGQEGTSPRLHTWAKMHMANLELFRYWITYNTYMTVFYFSGTTPIFTLVASDWTKCAIKHSCTRGRKKRISSLWHCNPDNRWPCNAIGKWSLYRYIQHWYNEIINIWRRDLVGFLLEVWDLLLSLA
jgi:hypothetical protein